MPFDHARCPSCQAILDPERLEPGPTGPLCPRCGTALSFVDVFGVAAQFAEEEQEELTLDDLVPGSRPKPQPSASSRDPLTLDSLVPTRKR